MALEHCNDYELPIELKEGIKCTRWLQTEKGQFKNCGTIRLIEPKETWRDPEPMPMYYCEKIGKTINVHKQMWVVELKEDAFSAPVITSTWVYYKHSTGVIHIPDELDYQEEE